MVGLSNPQWRDDVNHLKRGLSVFDLVVIGIAGAVGTGVLFSTAGMVAATGPGVIWAWLVGAIMYLFVGLTYVDLSRAFPEAGGPSRYSFYSHGRTTNMINAFADLIWYLFVPPVEALAAVEGINYFYPHLVTHAGSPTTLGALIGVALMLIFLPFNYYGVRAFAKSTNILGFVKIILYVLMAVGFFGFAHWGNFSRPDGWMPFGASGIMVAVPLSMFAFGGIRVIPDYAEEMRQPEKIGHAIIWVVLGQTVLYLLLAVGFLTGLNWAALKLPVGSWSSVSQIPGNPFLTIAGHAHVGWLIGITAAIAIIGPFVTGYIYQGAGSRILLAMSRTGLVSKRMQEIHKEHAIPAWALFSFTIVGAIVTYIAAPLPSIYNLISDAVVAGYLGFSVNPVVMLSLRRNGKPGFIRWGRVVAILAFGFASVVVYWSGWPSVPYATILLALFALIFGFLYHVGDGLKNAWWYIVYILFLVLMTYLGDVGARNLFSVDVGSVIVFLVSLVVFLPWGVTSRVRDPANS